MFARDRKEKKRKEKKRKERKIDNYFCNWASNAFSCLSTTCGNLEKTK